MTKDRSQRGVSMIARAFQDRRASGGRVLIPYLMMGDPDFDESMELVKLIVREGADLIELGMPFSDPLADGPVIQRAGQRSLAAGTTLPKTLDGVRALRADGVTIPFILMTYYNPLLRYGVSRLAPDLSRAGIDGLIVVDLPPEESEQLDRTLADHEIALVYLVAPTTTDRRLDLIVHLARGFLYYVSRTGVTGERKDVAADLTANLARVRQRTDLPVVVGFGVSNVEQAKAVSEHADGVVIGSAVVRIIESATRDTVRQNVIQFLRPILACLH